MSSQRPVELSSPARGTIRDNIGISSLVAWRLPISSEEAIESCRRSCHGLAWFGINLDEACGRTLKNLITDPASRCRVIVLPSQDDEQISRHTWAISQSLS